MTLSSGTLAELANAISSAVLLGWHTPWKVAHWNLHRDMFFCDYALPSWYVCGVGMPGLGGLSDMSQACKQECRHRSTDVQQLTRSLALPPLALMQC